MWYLNPVVIIQGDLSMPVRIKVSFLISLSLLCCLFATAKAPAEDTSPEEAVKEESPTKSQDQTKTKSSSQLDDNSLFGGINFVQGMKKSGVESTQDEIEGEVEVTTNPYTSIPEPTGLISGVVFEPSKDGKQPSSSNADMITGLANLLNAMQSSKK